MAIYVANCSMPAALKPPGLTHSATRPLYLVPFCTWCECKDAVLGAFLQWPNALRSPVGPAVPLQQRVPITCSLVEAVHVPVVRHQPHSNQEARHHLGVLLLLILRNCLCVSSRRRTASHTTECASEGRSISWCSSGTRSWLVQSSK